MVVPTDEKLTYTTSAICGSARPRECGRRDADAEPEGARGVHLAADRHSTRVTEVEEVDRHEETYLSALSFEYLDVEVAVGSGHHNHDHVAVAHRMARSRPAKGTDSQISQLYADSCRIHGVVGYVGYSAGYCTNDCPTVARLAQTCCSWSWRSYEHHYVDRAPHASLEGSREKTPECSLW
jgi:hypothetical protein